MRLSAAFLAIVLLAPVGYASDKAAQSKDPVAFGMLSHNSGCVIFGEGRKTSGMFWGVAVTTKTVGKLTAVETQNYTMPEKVYLETQDTMDDLMRLSQKDKIKYIKIPEKYAQDQLDKARAMCAQDNE
jgi:hypothetical protein